MGGGNLHLRARQIALVGEQLSQLCSHCKRWRIFGLRARVQVLLEPLNGHLNLDLRMRQIRSAVDQRRAVMTVQ